MKKTFKTLTLMLLSALAFSSCVDVPVPYNLPTKNSSTETTIEPTGEGTAASPFNVAAIVAKVLELEAGVESTEEYYIKGKVSKVTTDAATISQYGNHTFEMIDEGGDKSTVFTAFQVYGPGKKKFTSVDDIKVDDIVVVCGRVVNFRGNKPETVGKGAAYVVSINESGESGSGSEDEGTAISVAKAVELTQALANGATSAETYSVVGYITDTDGNVSKNQQIFWMADTKDGGKIFEAYWANLPEGVSAFTVGMKVKITGNLIKYVSKTNNVTCEMKNPTVVILTDDGGGTTPVGDIQHITIAEFLEKADASTTYELTGIVRNITNTLYGNFDLVEGDASIYIYGLLDLNGEAQKFASLGIVEGDEITITGKYKLYNSKAEIEKAQLISINKGGGGTDVPSGEAKGSGTEADPYNAIAAIQYAKSLGTDVESENDVYVTGIISSIKYTYSSDFGTATYNISVDGKASNEFTVYGSYYLNNQPWKDGDTQIKVGDEVVVCGKVVYFKGNTPEFANKKNWLVSIKDSGTGGGGQGGDDPTPNPGGDEVTELVNGDFESWESDSEATGWKSASSASSATVSKSTEARNGNYACKVAVPTGTGNARLATQEITLEAGSYTFSYYAKAATAEFAQTKGGHVPVTNGAVGAYTYLKTFTDLSNTEWTLVSYDFELTSTTTVCLLIMNPKTNTNYTAQDILVDDATLVKK